MLRRTLVLIKICFILLQKMNQDNQDQAKEKSQNKLKKAAIRNKKTRTKQL